MIYYSVVVAPLVNHYTRSGPLNARTGCFRQVRAREAFPPCCAPRGTHRAHRSGPVMRGRAGGLAAPPDLPAERRQRGSSWLGGGAKAGVQQLWVGGYFSLSARQGRFFPTLRASGHARSSSERAGDAGTRWGGLPPPQTPPPGVVSEAPHGWAGARKRVFSACAAAMTGKKFHQT